MNWTTWTKWTNVVRLMLIRKPQMNNTMKMSKSVMKIITPLLATLSLTSNQQ